MNDTNSPNQPNGSSGLFETPPPSRRHGQPVTQTPTVAVALLVTDPLKPRPRLRRIVFLALFLLLGVGASSWIGWQSSEINRLRADNAKLRLDAINRPKIGKVEGVAMEKIVTLDGCQIIFKPNARWIFVNCGSSITDNLVIFEAGALIGTPSPTLDPKNVELGQKISGTKGIYGVMFFPKAVHIEKLDGYEWNDLEGSIIAACRERFPGPMSIAEYPEEPSPFTHPSFPRQIEIRPNSGMIESLAN